MKPVRYRCLVHTPLTGELVKQWQNAHPGGQIITRDLTATYLPPINAEWISAVHAPEGNLTPRRQEMLSLSNEPITELRLS